MKILFVLATRFKKITTTIIVPFLFNVFERSCGSDCKYINSCFKIYNKEKNNNGKNLWLLLRSRPLKTMDACKKYDKSKK